MFCSRPIHYIQAVVSPHHHQGPGLSSNWGGETWKMRAETVLVYSGDSTQHNPLSLRYNLSTAGHQGSTKHLILQSYNLTI